MAAVDRAHLFCQSGMIRGAHCFSEFRKRTFWFRAEKPLANLAKNLLPKLLRSSI